MAGQVILMAAYLLLPYVLPLAGMTMVALLIVLPRVYLRKVSRMWQMAQTL